MTRNINNVSAAGNPHYPSSTYVDSMLKLDRWNLPTSTATGQAITFSFPGTTAHYPSFTQYIGGLSSHNFDTTGTDGTVFPSFGQATNAVQTVARFVLTNQFSAVANILFEERPSGSLQADGTAQNFFASTASNYQNGVDLSISMANLTSGGSAFQPGGGRRSGDIWFDTTNNRFEDAPLGSNDYRVIIHEIGHALGLRHPHEGTANDLNGDLVMPLDRDTMEFSVMTYRMYPGAFSGVTDIPFSYPSSVESYGFAQSLMMLDIQALQFMYGANFNYQSDNTVYSFSPTNGQMSINGEWQAEPGANRIFRTIWDGNGTDTYDLSSYSTSLSIDLAPGGWSVFDQSQLAILNTDDGTRARGNLFNALQYQGDARSLIENAIGGSAGDTLAGNSAANLLVGNAGADTLEGRGGADTLDGGRGADVAVYTSGIAPGYMAVRDATGRVMLTGGSTDGDALVNVETLRFANGDRRIGQLVDQVTNDFTNDGTSDLLWRQTATGNLALWELSGSQIIAAGGVPNAGGAWAIADFGDYNGDGHADLLWRNSLGNQDTAIWLMDSNGVAQGIGLPNPGASWRLIGSGDFDADGRDDVLWRNVSTNDVAIWHLDGAGGITSGIGIPNPGAAWHVVGIADFNNDERADILWRNDSGNHDLALWRVNGVQDITGFSMPNPGVAWHVAGTGDYDGDGRDDIVWRHDNGDVAIWGMNNNVIANGYGAPNPGLGWTLTTGYDVNGDGRDDLVWRNATNGDAAVWTMQGGTILQGLGLANPGTGWTLLTHTYDLV